MLAWVIGSPTKILTYGVVKLKGIDNMRKEDLEKLLNGESVKVRKNQIYLDSDNYFVVEKYEYTENKIEFFSVFDGYRSIELAIKTAKSI